MGGYWRVNFFFKLRHVNELNREMNSSETWITEPFEQHHYELELRSLSSAELFLNSELWITEHIVELWAQKHIIITSHELRTENWHMTSADIWLNVNFWWELNGLWRLIDGDDDDDDDTYVNWHVNFFCAEMRGRTAAKIVIVESCDELFELRSDIWLVTHTSWAENWNSDMWLNSDVCWHLIECEKLRAEVWWELKLIPWHVS